MGTGLGNQVIIHHFIRTLADRRIKKQLLTRDFAYLQEAAEMAAHLETAYKRDARNREATNTTTPTPKIRTVCYHCKKPGHKAAMCPSKKATTNECQVHQPEQESEVVEVEAPTEETVVEEIEEEQ